MNYNSAGIMYLKKNTFPIKTESKIKEGIFFGSQIIRELIQKYNLKTGEVKRKKQHGNH